MKFIPSYTLNVISEQSFATEIEKIEAALEECINFGEFTAFDNTRIYYEYFLAQESKGNIVIVHGLSEFTKKFNEFIYYALNQGYNVFIYDQRCHGLSGRLTKNKDLLHVDDFYDYALDLEYFIDNIVTKNNSQPIYFYAHSMGGTVCALYLEKHPDKIKKAVFSAPMIKPVVKKVSPFIARQSVILGKVFLGSKKSFFLSSDFNPNVKYTEEYCSSRARFDYHMKLRIGNEYYQSSPMSYGWVYNSLTIYRTILKKKFLEKIQTPILLFSAENDKTVENQPHYIFSNGCKDCTLIEVKGETHALLASKNEKLEKILKLTFDYFS